MPDWAAPAAPEVVLTAELVRREGRLWPWIARFLWAPALDLHPERRAALLPGWPEALWREPASLEHLSRHLLASAEPLPAWHSGASAFRLALLPQPPLALLARRLELALRGGGSDLNDDDARFLMERAPLYWRPRPDAGGVAGTAGWAALRAALAGQPAAVRTRFDWKTPPIAMQADGANDGDSDALLALTLRILREFEEPWSCLFVTPIS
ncbi:hypothetical protein [Rugamonas aquatica]|uniref:Uncharacterized protein n=1 Tax=Rugamonas aquatica TaxID=2743357 RepID=A0A6A7N6V6_9BURK|nr:hypothetical protein [Rugamonas aquatica]MQA40729.1 hypothetical protein [Rugamonas aquatica]